MADPKYSQTSPPTQFTMFLIRHLLGLILLGIGILRGRLLSTVPARGSAGQGAEGKDPDAVKAVAMPKQREGLGRRWTASGGPR